MFYYLQIVRYKATGEELIYRGPRGADEVFVKNGKEVAFFASQITKNDFEEIYETVKLFGKTPIKRLKRIW